MTVVGPTRVLIVDDHAMVRRGLREFLALFDDIEVVGEAADGREALSASESLRPDVVVMDLNLPRLDGIEATRELRATHPEIEVVALTGAVEEERVMAAVEDQAVTTGGAEYPAATILASQEYADHID